MANVVKDEMRLRIGVRDEAPCKACPERFLACSDHCPKDERGEFGYKAWRATIKETNKRRTDYYNDMRNERRRSRWKN